MSKTELVKLAFANYQKSVEKTEERRKVWEESVKNTLINTLTRIKESFSSNYWGVQIIDNVSNYQTVNITSFTRSSGIIENDIDFSTKKVKSTRSFKKHGGYLAFCQSYNGKINIIIGYPYIDELVRQIEPNAIGTIDPQDITEDFIYEKVIFFLDQITNWENGDLEPSSLNVEL